MDPRKGAMRLSKESDWFIDNGIEDITFRVVLDMQLKCAVGNTFRMFGGDKLRQANYINIFKAWHSLDEIQVVLGQYRIARIVKGRAGGPFDEGGSLFTHVMLMINSGAMKVREDGGK